jgi:hypothetical protein
MARIRDCELLIVTVTFVLLCRGSLFVACLWRCGSLFASLVVLFAVSLELDKKPKDGGFGRGFGRSFSVRVRPLSSACPFEVYNPAPDLRSTHWLLRYYYTYYYRVRVPDRTPSSIFV